MNVKLDGRQVSNEIYAEIKKGQKYAKTSKTLAIITVGNDEASQVYVKSKKVKAVECGFKFMHIQMSEDTTYFDLEKTVDSLNKNDTVNGIIIQKPLPQQLRVWDKMIDELVDPSKDIDGFHPMSNFKSCTPKGIITLLDNYVVPYQCKNVVIAGRSKIVAQPLAKMFMDRDCTVTMIHSHTPEHTVRNLIENCDVFVSAIGKPHYWTKDYFSDTQNKKLAIIDVGINRITTFNDFGTEVTKVVGDVHPDCYQYFNYYTPVPGGVGLMTVATLINNLSITNN